MSEGLYSIVKELSLLNLQRYIRLSNKCEELIYVGVMPLYNTLKYNHVIKANQSSFPLVLAKKSI